MKIKFLNVKIKGFFSISEAEVNLENSGFTLISGINNFEEDKAKSNGVGKSSLTEAILYCLTGETLRGTNDVVNKYLNEGTRIELNFIIDNDKYRLIRYKEDKEFGTNLKIFINNQDKSGKGIRDTQKILEQYLPDLNTQLLGSVIILGQGLPQKFTNNTPSGRKEILEKLSKSDFMIQDIKDKLSLRKEQLSKDLRQQEDLSLKNTTELNLMNESLLKLNSQLQNLKNPNEEDFDEQESNKKLTLYKNEKLDVVTKKASNKDNINSSQKEMNNLIKEENEACQTIYSKYKSELNNKKDNITKLKLEISNLEKEILKLKNIKDICPTCGQKLKDVHKVDTTNMENELEVLEFNLEQYQTNYDNLLKEQDEEINKCKKDYESNYLVLESQSQDYYRLDEQYTKLETTLQNNINNLTIEIDRHKLLIEQYEITKNNLHKEISETQGKIKDLQDLLYNINIDKDTINSHIDIVNKMSIIASRDFRGFLLSNVIDYINTKAKEYSQEIFNTTNIEFKLEGNNIYIGYNGKVYESLSGGEKQKVDLIVQFSIRDMLSQFLNFSSNILVLDEIFDGLDQIGCQQIINLISSKFLDIESIFIITHHLELDIPCDNEIIIVKNKDGISEIQ